MREIHEIDTLKDFFEQGHELRDCVVQGLNIGRAKVDWDRADVDGAVFLGCRFPSLTFQEKLREGGALIFPRLQRIPYQAYRPSLYTVEELAEGWSETEDLSLDKIIYDHFIDRGRESPNILEGLSQRLHDFSMDDALGDLLEGRIEADGEKKKVVAIMGGHSTARTDPWYAKVVEIARSLTRNGYFVASGGGPGIMEAANLGAWIANADDDLMSFALATLAEAPDYRDPGYIAAANRVRLRHPEGCSSLAIPTWFYGHEPSNAFSTWIAKYFSNSLREDGLLAIAKYGIVFAPGSAGTMQEVFQDAAQNHYGTFGQVSPMVFLNQQHYEENGAYSTLTKLAEGKQYADYLGIANQPDDIVKFIVDHPPVSYRD